MKLKIIAISFSFLLTGCQSTAALNTSTVYKNMAVASWYQSGRKTASGQRFDPNGNTVAHRTLPFGTKLKLTNLRNGKSVIATVNDRGPFVRGTELDVARGAAQKLDFIKSGKTKLKVEILR